MGAGERHTMRRRAWRARMAREEEARASLARYAPAPRKRPGPIMSTISVLVAVAFGLLLDGFLLHNQLEIAQVMTTGRPAQATVKAVECSRGRSDLGDVTVTFTDASGTAHTIAHTSDTFGCYDSYAPGDVITIRYAPGDPTAILTQQEIAGLPIMLVFYGLADILFVISPPVLLVWLGWEKGAPWLRLRWAAWRGP